MFSLAGMTELSTNMKKLLLISVLLLFLFSFNASAWNPFLISSGTGAVCAEVYAPSLTSDAPKIVGGETNRHYIGFRYDPASSECICAIDFYVDGITGTITSYVYYAAIFALDSSTPKRLNSLMGTSGSIAGSALVSDTWISANAGTISVCLLCEC